MKTINNFITEKLRIGKSINIHKPNAGKFTEFVAKLGDNKQWWIDGGIWEGIWEITFAVCVHNKYEQKFLDLFLNNDYTDDDVDKICSDITVLFNKHSKEAYQYLKQVGFIQQEINDVCALFKDIYNYADTREYFSEEEYEKFVHCIKQGVENYKAWKLD